jgi:cyclopropane fatty-acyl-phospholipid synthase-like methyltransferase
MEDVSRAAWQRLYAKHGLQYGGVGDIRPLEPYLVPGMLVLDAGCGDGKTTELLAKKCEVVGCDFSREALISLRSQRPALHQLNLVECNILKLPFEHEKFDAVSCVHALSHMNAEDRSSAAAEISNVLKRGGYVLLEAFGRRDVRFGEGVEVEEATYLRGNGIMTHYFLEGEIPLLFPSFATISEVSEVRRISLGAVAGKRDTMRTLMQKTA